MNRWSKIFLGVAALVVAIGMFGPRERVDWTLVFHPDDLGSDLDAYLDTAEGYYSDIIPGAQKEIVWFAGRGQKTPVSVVYVHGFSATKEEIRPVPDLFAQRLGANLFFTRLSGHGRGSAAMAEPTANDWLNDMAEALAIGRRLGDKVIVLSTSTGGTLAALVAADPEMMADVAGLAFVSPNFAINNPSARLLTLPFAKQLLPLVLGRERSFEPLNEKQAAWWTTRYPSTAVFPMAALVKEALSVPFETVLIPAFFAFDPRDTVVKASETAKVAARWTGPTTVWEVEVGPGDDPSFHVIAGDIMSPGMTGAMVEQLAEWVSGL